MILCLKIPIRTFSAWNSTFTGRPKGGYDAVDYLKKYSGRFPLLHIKDEEEIGQSGTMDFEPIFKAAYAQGMKGYYMEVERYNFKPVKSVAMSYEYLANSNYAK